MRSMTALLIVTLAIVVAHAEESLIGTSDTTVIGRVCDAKTRKPIPSFVVYQASKRSTGGRHWLLLSGSAKTYYAGTLTWPSDQRPSGWLLRIEAPGYRTRLIKLPENPDDFRPLDIRLVQDAGRLLRVVDESGQPLTAARAAIGLVGRSIVLLDGQVSGTKTTATDLSRPVLLESDANGAIRLHYEPAKAFVMISHEYGFLGLPNNELANRDEVVLRRWGQIEGRLMWGDDPVAGETIRLNFSRPGGHAAYVIRRHTVTDGNGAFSFDRIPPGQHSLLRVGWDGKTYADHLSFPNKSIEVMPGKTAQVVLGGRGRPVIGRIVGDWQSEKLRLVLTRHPGGSHSYYNTTSHREYVNFLKQTAGHGYVPSDIAITADGAFRIDRVPSGRYSLFLEKPTNENAPVPYTASWSVNVGPMTGGENDEPLDLQLLPVPTMTVGNRQTLRTTEIDAETAQSEQPSWAKEITELKEALLQSKDTDPLDYPDSLRRIQHIFHMECQVVSRTKDADRWDFERRLLLRRWLQMLNAVRQRIDADWDPDDRPYLSVPIPRNGFYYSGMSPSAIKEPKLRKQYEERIQKHREKSRRYGWQLGLRRLKSDLKGHLTRCFIRQYSDTPEDRSLILEAINREIDDLEHRRELAELLLCDLMDTLPN